AAEQVQLVHRDTAGAGQRIGGQRLVGIVEKLRGDGNVRGTPPNDGTVVKLAQGIYDDRAFARLPILADALEEAGCMDTEILDHCRRAREHVRGCWVLDLLLGKE